MSPRVLVALLCAVNLIAGLALGIVVDRTVLTPEHRPWGPRGGRRGPPDMTVMLTERLELDAEQAKKVREILAARRPAFDAAIKQARAESDRQIREILRPDQVTKFDELLREWAEKRHEHEHHSGKEGGR